jgi:hypothetical protein
LVLDQLTAAVGEDGGRLIRHAHYYWLLLAESHLTRQLLRACPYPKETESALSGPPELLGMERMKKTAPTKAI